MHFCYHYLKYAVNCINAFAFKTFRKFDIHIQIYTLFALPHVEIRLFPSWGYYHYCDLRL